MIVVTPCGRLKAPTPQPAQDLYRGSTFELGKGAALALGLPWLILSGKYGLVEPGRVLEPYEQHIGRSIWPVLVGQQSMVGTHRVLSLCPQEYSSALVAAFGSRVHCSFTGLSLGWQRHAYKRIAEVGSLTCPPCQYQGCPWCQSNGGGT